MELVADIGLAERLFETLRAMSLDPPGVTRAAYGPGEQRAHDLVRETGAALGLSARTDAAGNLYMTMAGRDPDLPAWFVGSHLDTVPHGGNYDGAAGVLAPLAAISALRGAGVVPRRPVTVIVTRAEESTWFPASFIGSRAALGTLPREALDVRRVDTGRTLAEHMRDAGGTPERIAAGEPQVDVARIHGFVELHIEQGPVLETEQIPVGVVTGISGSFRYREGICLGAYAHSGAVPRSHRQDAVMALAELAVALDRRWAALDAAGVPATVTFGQVATDPEQHAFSKVPGEVRFCLDVRSARSEVLEELHAFLMQEAGAIAARRGVRFDFGPRTGTTPATMDAGLVAQCSAIAAGLGIGARGMPSGAGHDAAAFAAAGVPSVMLFVRNQNGSHNPDEAMRLEDFAAGATLIAHLIAEAS